jgi:aspartate beta-hydroxylase
MIAIRTTQDLMEAIVGFLYERSTEWSRGVYDRRISAPSVLEAAAFFPDARRFGAAWEALRDEALGVARDIQKVPRFHELMEQQREISAQDDRDWRLFVLKAYGVAVARNLDQCPALAELLATSPDVLSAAFSYLAPHKHIPRHRGPYRGVLRFYLGLSVPLSDDARPGTLLKIEDTEHRIGNGEYLLWDDTFPHEVWNHSDAMRIALLLDIRRRGMPRDLELLSRVIERLAGATIRLRGIF